MSFLSRGFWFLILLLGAFSSTTNSVIGIYSTMNYGNNAVEAIGTIIGIIVDLGLFFLQALYDLILVALALGTLTVTSSFFYFCGRRLIRNTDGLLEARVDPAATGTPHPLFGRYALIQPVHLNGSLVYV